MMVMRLERRILRHGYLMSPIRTADHWYPKKMGEERRIKRLRGTGLYCVLHGFVYGMTPPIRAYH